jgi:hypothetical protein
VEKPRTAPKHQKGVKEGYTASKIMRISFKKIIQLYAQLRKQQSIKVPTQLHQNVLIMAIAKLKV